MHFVAAGMTVLLKPRVNFQKDNHHLCQFSQSNHKIDDCVQTIPVAMAAPIASVMVSAGGDRIPPRNRGLSSSPANAPCRRLEAAASPVALLLSRLALLTSLAVNTPGISVQAQAQGSSKSVTVTFEVSQHRRHLTDISAQIHNTTPRGSRELIIFCCQAVSSANRHQVQSAISYLPMLKSDATHLTSKLWQACRKLHWQLQQRLPDMTCAPVSVAVGGAGSRLHTRASAWHHLMPWEGHGPGGALGMPVWKVPGKVRVMAVDLLEKLHDLHCTSVSKLL